MGNYGFERIMLNNSFIIHGEKTKEITTMKGVFEIYIGPMQGQLGMECRHTAPNLPSHKQLGRRKLAC